MPELTLTDFAHRKWGDAKKKRLEFAQIYCKAGSSHSRVSAVIEAFCAAAAGDHEIGNVDISYLLHCTADVTIARSRYQQAVRPFGDEGHTFTFTTFASWRDDGGGDRQILLLDTSRSTTSSIDTLAMLEITQKLSSRAQKEWLQCLVVSVSGDLDPLVWRDGVPLVQTYKLDGPEFPEARHDEEGWESKTASLAVDRLSRRLEDLNGLEEHQIHLLDENRWGPTLVLLMRYEDAAELFNRLKQICPRIEFSRIMPWSSSRDIRQSIGPSHWLKLIYINDGVTVLPLIEHSEVLIGPKGTMFLFNKDMLCTTAVSNATLNIEGRLQAAFSLSSPPPAVHTFVTSGQPRLDAPSPAFGSQLLHLRLFCIDGCEDRHPIDLPIKFPDDKIMLFEAVRRLGTWGLADCEGAVQKISHPLGAQPGRFSRLTSNINAAVLLGGISEDMSNVAANILVDMAVMVCQGPSSIFCVATADAKKKITGYYLGLLSEPLFWLARKGQLWLSVACLNAFRRVTFPEGLWSLLRRDVLSHARVRAIEIKRQLNIPEADVKVELTAIDIQTVEEQLARSFLFNVMLKKMSVDHFAVDFVSRAKLSKPENDNLDWERLVRESDTPGVVAGIYTYLDSTWEDEIADSCRYRAQDVTIISMRTIFKVLCEVVPDGERLSPLWEPLEALRVDEAEVARYFEGFEIAEKQNTGTRVLVEEEGGSTGHPVAAAKVKATQDSGVGMQASAKFSRKAVALPYDDSTKLVASARWQKQPRPLF